MRAAPKRTAERMFFMTMFDRAASILSRGWGDQETRDSPISSLLAEAGCAATDRDLQPFQRFYCQYRQFQRLESPFIDAVRVKSQVWIFLPSVITSTRAALNNFGAPDFWPNGDSEMEIVCRFAAVL